MRGVYEALIKCSAVVAAKTLIYITAPAAACVEILSTSITNGDNVTNDQLEACWQRIGTLGTPSATTLTPSKMESGDQAAASTVKGNVTGSEPTYTANTEFAYQAFSNLGGYYYDPLPETRPIIPPSGSVGLRLLDTPASTEFFVRVVFREIG